MKIHSLCSTNEGAIPVEVEVRLWPGLPEIKITGLPDQNLKESTLRIKSALRAQGFTFPASRQVLVNLTPSHLKKSSQGLELAIAVGFLWESGQAPLPEFGEEVFVYGGLSLDGTLTKPRIPVIRQSFEDTVFIGNEIPRLANDARFWRIESLQDLTEPPKDLPLVRRSRVIERPEPPEILVSRQEARFLKIAALTGAHCLLAGPAGSGKSTLAKALHTLARPLEFGEQLELPEELSWRPHVIPHHTIPIISFIGGGGDAHGGELARSHLGILQLDELLEYKSPCLEALREPMENKVMRIARGNTVRMQPCSFQAVATTNLCPCGDFVPGKSKPACRFPLPKCRSYGLKFSGPLIDRFELGMFTRHTHEREIPVADILRDLENQFYKNGFRGLPAQFEFPLMMKGDLDTISCSQRRRVAIMRTALTISLLEGADRITMAHYGEALDWAFHPFRQLQRWDALDEIQEKKKEKKRKSPIETLEPRLT